MATPRDNHTATLLPDGRVLVAGGLNRFGPGLASAEIYDPRTATWSTVARMRTGRYHHTATLLKDGRVLVVGGGRTVHGERVFLSSAEIYDPVRNTWRSAGRFPIKRANHTATLLGDGRVLVAGGGDRAPGFTSDAEIYNPRTNRWSRAPRMPEPRGFHTATLLASGQVLIAGGWNDRGDVVRTERYNPLRRRWSSAGDLPSPGAHNTATGLLNGRVLVAGGQHFSGALVSGTGLYKPR
jgi:N-acetylneuraminic acid mutarotase